MKATQLHFKIRELKEGYTDTKNPVGLSGRLTIRPEFQRLFIYSKKKQQSVIETILDGAPIGIWYWVSRFTPGSYEVLDGQQRLLSILEYINGKFSVNYKYFSELPQKDKDKILDYETITFLISPDAGDSIYKWWERINYAGNQLEEIEILNGTYCGKLVLNLKRNFLSNECQYRYDIATYVCGKNDRGEAMFEVLYWFLSQTADIDKKVELPIRIRMLYEKERDNEGKAIEIETYFNNVMSWAKENFQYDRCFTGVDWGILYNKYKDVDTTGFKEKQNELFADPDVTNKKGVVEYLFTGDEKLLSIRTFEKSDIVTAKFKQNNKCYYCGEEFSKTENVFGDHIVPWSKGGRTIIDNLAACCFKCNMKKGNKMVM